MDTHDGIMLYDYWTKVSKGGFKFINVYRNPIDTVASWEKHGMGKLEKLDLTKLFFLKITKIFFLIIT